MSKIDDTQTAISAAQESLGEAVSTMSAAAQEAEQAQQGLLAAGAEANAEFLLQCKVTIEKAAAAVTAVNSLLDKATEYAEAGKG